MRTALLLALLLLASTAVRAEEEGELREAERLVQGVATIALPGVPGTLSVFGPKAFSIVAAPSGGRPAPLVAATRHGKGRAVLFGHGYFGDALRVGDTARLVENVLRWAAGDAETPRIGVRGGNRLEKHLGPAGFTFVPLSGKDWTGQLGDVDAIVLPLANVTEEELKILEKRLKRGLGIVAGMPGWGWQQLHPKEDLATDNMANRLLAPAGLVWGAEFVKKPASGVLAVRGPAPALTHAGEALAALKAQADGKRTLSADEGATAVANLTRAVREVPPDDRLLLPALADLEGRADDPRFLPSHRAPLTDAQGLGKVLLATGLQRLRGLAPSAIPAHPAAATFPGAVPEDAKRVRRTVSIDTKVPGWHGTGLYAPPGEVVTLKVSPKAMRSGLALRIGAHKDRLWGKPAWRRAPEVTRTWPVNDRRTQAACAFGGLIYVDVPARSELGAIAVEIDRAVEAPRYVLGTTSLEDWRETLRQHPAPWAELETSKVILTVPSEHVRALDDPEALMRWWDVVMDSCADLATIPRARSRPERYVTDEQISAGYMHAGYPIMTHLDAAPRFVDLAKLSTKGDWGMFHEMGHNHQSRDWTFGGTGEVTVNLFSLYLMETVCSKGIGHPAMAPESVTKHRKAFLESRDPFGHWKSKPFTGLIMYHQLKEAFGWEAYKKVFAEYRALPANQRPKSDAEKRDQWLVRMSRTVGRNLGPFFASWSVPVSEQARKAVADLPTWMPE